MLSCWLCDPTFLKVNFVHFNYTVRRHNTIEQKLMQLSYLILINITGIVCIRTAHIWNLLAPSGDTISGEGMGGRLKHTKSKVYEDKFISQAHTCCKY